MEGTQQAEWLWEEVAGVLQAELAREAAALCRWDLREIEARVQPLLRRVGGALLSGSALDIRRFALGLLQLLGFAGKGIVDRPFKVGHLREPI
jgi:hypothetical protein